MLYTDYLKKIKKDGISCPFCSDVTIRIIEKNEYAFLTYAIAPYHKHHLLVIPFRHTKSFLNLTKQEVHCIDELLKKAITLLHKLGYKNCSILMRDNDTKNKSIDHLHYNIVPNVQLGDLDHDSNARKIMTDNEIKLLLKNINKHKTSINKKTIHFICSGNTYRSRLAEAYFNSKQIKEFKAISSGINATELAIYPVRWYTEKISEENKLEKHLSPTWRQTSASLIEASDLLIFLSQDVFDQCSNFQSKVPYEIWNISDLDLKKPDILIIKDSKTTYSKIKKNVNFLLKNL